ncbi:MAG: alpha/beta hydrolase family protein [Desulfocapsaceae bacterium]
MKRKLIRFSVVFSLIVMLLLLPVVFKEKDHPALVGPDLSEVDYSEIFFKNRHENLQLSGMLFLPEGEGPFPTAVIIHGSGTSRRNNVWYISVAHHLQQHGIAVLLPDKRGSEKSEGEWLGASFEELATDTVSAVEFVKHQQMFEYSTIGLLGMSQGGWIAPVVAAKTEDVSFIVSMSGAAVTTEEQLLHEEIYNIDPYTYTFLAKLIAPISSGILMKKDFFIPTAEFDPIPYWKDVHVPVFFALGGNDKNVPVDASIRRLKENNLNHFTMKIYPDGGHAIRDIQTNKVNEEFLNDLVKFIKEVKQAGLSEK